MTDQTRDPAQDERMSREALIEIIMRETTDEIVADGWDVLGRPNVLVQGCKFIRRNIRTDPTEGYADPDDAAKRFAGLIADAILAPRPPAEGERQRCMEILEDVPGETLVDRVNRLKDWHQELSNSYHDAIAEARTERDQAVSQVEDALKSLETEKLNLLKRREIHDWRPGTEAWDRCFGELAGLNRAVEILNTSAHSSTDRKPG